MEIIERIRIAIDIILHHSHPYLIPQMNDFHLFLLFILLVFYVISFFQTIFKFISVLRVKEG